MKMFRCEKCGTAFAKKEEETNVVCPKCSNADSETLVELNEEEANVILNTNKARKMENIFHISLFTAFLVLIVVLTIIIKVMGE